MLRTRDLVSGYGRSQTLHGVDVDVPAGKVSTVIGPNGSGKTTFLKTVAGLVRPWSGSVRLDGDEVSGRPAHLLVRAGLCLVPQGRVVFPFLTVEENLRMFAFTAPSRDEVRVRLAEAYEFMPVLADRRAQQAGTLSGGEQAMLSIAKVIMLRPKLLLLDEPSLGLSPKLVDLVYERIAALSARGLTTLIVEQNVRTALAAAQHVLVLVLGRVRYQGDADSLQGEVDLARLFIEGRG